MPAVPSLCRGAERVCKTWSAEAAYRLLLNNLHPEVAENPAELIVYGGIGKAARNHECLAAILRCLRELGPDETLLVQSGKPVGILPTHPDAPRVLIANSNLVGNWNNWETFHQLDRKGLMMYGQMTAGSWIYIGSQGILQGTYETFAACGRKHFTPSDASMPLLGRLVVSAGLGGMGGAQPLAAKLAGAVFIGIDADAARIERRLQSGYLDEICEDMHAALRRADGYLLEGKPRSLAVCVNAAAALEELLDSNVVPDVVTDQTSAHDPLNGYIPDQLTLSAAEALRRTDAASYIAASYATIARHMHCLLKLKARGAVVFDYGNNLRGAAVKAGVENAFDIPGFVPEYIRPMFCEGCGPFRWVALSGDPEDISVTDRCLLGAFPENAALQNWLRNGAPKVKFQGLPARICWLRHREREHAGVLLNDLVRIGAVGAPIAIGRDHLDAGSVASPYRETEAMLDGSDAVADWPLLNAMINTACGADWVSIHNGGGVGIGLSQHAGMVVVADGTEAAERRLRRVLNADPATGVIRHADAGYAAAREWAADASIQCGFVKPSK